MVGPSELKVAEWAFAHDIESLRLVREHRDVLRAATDPSAALALARLFDTDGVDERVVQALNGMTDDSRYEAPVRLALGRAMFERGDLLACRSHLELVENLDDEESAFTASFALVRLLLLSGDQEAARQKYSECSTSYIESERRWPWVDALFAASESGQFLLQGRRQEARLSAERALRSALSYDGPEAALMAGLLGNIELDLGHAEAAERAFATAVRLGKKSGVPSVAAIFSGYRAWALHRGGDPKRAERVYRESIQACEGLGLGRFMNQFRALKATLRLGPNIVAERELLFQRALVELGATGDEERATGLAVLQVFFDLERARAAHERDPDGVEVFERLATAFGRLDRAHEDSDDARVAKKQARAAFDVALSNLSGSSAELRLAPGATHGWGPEGSFELQKYPVLSRILWLLAVGWAESRMVQDQELIDGAWPGEKILENAGKHRLRVAISSLRKAVGPVVQRVDGGYRLQVRTLDMVPYTSEARG